MLVWTHEDLFHFPSIETPKDFLGLILTETTKKVDVYHVALETFPQDETILNKLSGLFPDSGERAVMLGEDGLPSRTWLCVPWFAADDERQERKCQQLQQRILEIFKNDFVGPTKVPCPTMQLLESCVKRYCDQLSGIKHAHGYRGREEDWWLP